MASEIRAGKAYVELFLKGDFKKSLETASKQLKAFGAQVQDIGKKMAAIGTAVTAPLLVAAQRFAAMGEEIEHASQRTGVGVEALSALQYAAEQSGTSFEDLETGIKKMNKAIFEAEGSSESARKSLAGLPISVKELQGLSPDQQFLKIGEALNNVADSGAKSAIAMEIFGKGGTELLPFFERGAAGIEAMNKHAAELGIIMSGDDAKAATKFSEALDDVWKQINFVTFSIGAAVAQALQPFAEATTHVLATVIHWAKENRTLIIAVLGAGVAILTAGAAVIAFGATIEIVGVALGGIVTVVGLVGSAIALLVNPIVLVGAALIGLATYFVVSTKVGGEVLAWLGSKFNQLKDIATEAFGGIADALGAGDIILAAKILWVGLQEAWTAGTAELMQYWFKFRATFVQTAAAAFYGAEELWENVKASLRTSWADTVDFLGSLWRGFTDTFVNAWEVAVNAVSKGLNYIRSLWDKSFDPKEAAKIGDQMLADSQLQRDRAAISEQQKREADHKVALALINSDQQKATNDITNREMGVSAAADQDAQNDAIALAKKKADLKKQLDDLRAKASGEHKKKIDEDKGPTALDPSKLQSLTDVLQNREDVSSPAKGQGIFGGQGLQSLQSGPALTQKEIAKNTSDMKKYLAQIARQRQKFQ